MILFTLDKRANISSSAELVKPEWGLEQKLKVYSAYLAYVHHVNFFEGKEYRSRGDFLARATGWGRFEVLPETEKLNLENPLHIGKQMRYLLTY